MTDRFKETWTIDDINLTICTSSESIIDQFIDLAINSNITLETKVSFIEEIEENGSWSFLDKKDKRIYLWYDENYTNPHELIKMIAHELGHMQTPHNRDIKKEELKAIKYANVTYDAYEFLRAILEGDNDNNQTSEDDNN